MPNKRGIVLTLEREVHDLQATLGYCDADAFWLTRLFNSGYVHFIQGPLIYEFYDGARLSVRQVTTDSHAVYVSSAGNVVDIARRPGQRVFKNIDEYTNEAIIFI